MRQFIKELKAGDKVMDFFLVKSKRVKNTKTGKPYLDLDLVDRSGTINAKVWEQAEKFGEMFERGDVIKVEGVVEEFQGQRQLRLTRLRPVAQNEYSWEDLKKVSRHDQEAMLGFLGEVIQSFSNEHLKALLLSFFEDAEFVAAFQKSAAARNMHHAYEAGLLEHTCKVVKLCRYAAEEIYPGEVDRDLVLAGAILHDVGKVVELNSQAEIGYTTEGYLIGHVSLGSGMMRQRAAGIPDFPRDLLLQLDHILLSHHGEREFGSPVTPMTAEAMIVNNADNLDAKTQVALSAIADDPNLEEDFTQYHKTLARHFYKGPAKKNTPPDKTKKE